MMDSTTTYEVWFRRADGTEGSTAYTQFRTPRRPNAIAEWLNRDGAGIAGRHYFVVRATCRRTYLDTTLDDDHRGNTANYPPFRNEANL